MNVRNLIASLLEFNMDADIEVIVQTNEGDDNCDFDLEEITTYNNGSYLQFIVKPDGQVLVDEESYQSLKDENSHAEDKIAELEIAIEEYERQIQELESGE